MSINRCDRAAGALRFSRAPLRGIAVASLLGLGACVSAATAEWQSFAFDLPKSERTAVLRCEPGPTPDDTRARAEASAKILDDALFALSEDIKRRLQADFDGGDEFSARQLNQLSNATGEQAARTIFDRHACIVAA